MKVPKLIRMNLKIWLTTYAFLCGFNVGRGSWIGVAMFVAGGAGLIIFTNKVFSTLEASAAKNPHLAECPICRRDFDEVLKVMERFGFASCHVTGDVFMTRAKARRFMGTPETVRNN